MGKRNYTNLYEQLNLFNKNIKISYKGPFDERILSSIGNYIEVILGTQAQAASRKLFKIFIELAQNIAYYSAEKNKIYASKEFGLGTLVISEYDDCFTFITGNEVYDSSIIELIEKCEFINTLDRESLRKYKREQRRINPGERGNAHIGLIQVALTSANPLDIEVSPIEEGKSYFSIAVKIDK